jgi:hypothetical protein
VARFTGVSARRTNGVTRCDQLVDGVDLPGQVVEAYASILWSIGVADAEQPEVVVVARARQAKERGVRSRFAGGDLHAEHVAVEVLAGREVPRSSDGKRVVSLITSDGWRTAAW